MSTVPPPNAIEAAVALLTAARTADDPDVGAFYAARARSAIDALNAQLNQLRTNLKIVENELVARHAPKRLAGKEREG
jgi:hypothetical protein